MIITTQVDGINYILLHSHHSMIKDTIKLVNDYGRHDMFNVVVSGHYHTRVATKTNKRKVVDYETVKVVSVDELNYRAFVCPSIFTGNFYSESIGHASTSGCLIIENNGLGKINHYDFCLNG